MDNPAAFPCTGEGFQSEHYTQKGMSLRDWFAGHALAAFTFNEADKMAAGLPLTPAQLVASIAYDVADAMLAARKSGQPS